MKTLAVTALLGIVGIAVAAPEQDWTCTTPKHAATCTFSGPQDAATRYCTHKFRFNLDGPYAKCYTLKYGCSKVQPFDVQMTCKPK